MKSLDAIAVQIVCKKKKSRRYLTGKINMYELEEEVFM